MEKNEINDLLDGFLPPVDVNSEEPPAPPEEPPKEEPPAPETPLPDDVPGEPPPGEVTPPSPPQEPSAPEPPAPVTDPRDAEIQQMRDTIAALQQTIETVAKQAVTPVQKAQEPAVDAPLKFIEKEEDLDKALNSIDNFNEMLSGVVAKAREIILAEAQQISMANAHQVFTQRTAVNEFYSINQDLAANKAFVGVVANELAAAHPEWDMLEIIKNLGTEVRGRLKMSGVPPQAQAPIPPTPPGESPAFAGGSHSRSGGGSGSLTKIEKDVLDLISD